jgi:hypothetical protein
MKRPEERHYSEEELLVHMLAEDAQSVAAEVEDHIGHCAECSGILAGQRELMRLVGQWAVPLLGPAAWEEDRARLLEFYRQERGRRAGAGLSGRLESTLRSIWDYALENPLPTLGYIAAAVAFASERTITLFRLDRILPATGELIEILRQVF